MVSKRFISVFMFMAVVGVSFSVPEDDDATKVVNKEVDHHSVIQEEIKKFLSMMEKINIDQILNNDRLMSNNVKCFLNEGSCTAQLREMKKMLPVLIKDSCSSCTKEQRNMIKKAMDAIKARRPNEYERVTKFFDPEKKYEKKLSEKLNES
nr:chemosensory protein 10 [Acyrthosiphon pisum]